MAALAGEAGCRSVDFWRFSAENCVDDFFGNRFRSFSCHGYHHVGVFSNGLDAPPQSTGFARI